MYEKIPTRMIFPSVPIYSANNLVNDLARANSDKHLEEFSVVGAESFDGNVGDAWARAQNLLLECRNKVTQGNLWALLDLLDVHPQFVADIWVRETLVTLIRGDRLKRRRGRPFSSYKVHPLVVVGIVDTLVSIGEAAYLEKAFYCLADYKFLSYDEAKRRYHSARRDSRFKPIILRMEDQAELISVNEMDGELADAEILRHGQTIIRTAEDPDLEPVTISFSANE